MSTLTLNDLRNSSENLFKDNEIEIPPADIQLRDKFKALQELGLNRQAARADFEIRRQQLLKAGFKELTLAEQAFLLMGEHPKLNYYSGWRFDINNKWYTKFNRYRHNCYSNLEDKEIAFDTDFDYEFGVEEIKKWYTEYQKIKWCCVRGPLDRLNRDIPYGIVLKLNELNKLKVFNYFTVTAPIELFNFEGLFVDPIITANICDIYKDDGGRYHFDKTGMFFVAQW